MSWLRRSAPPPRAPAPSNNNRVVARPSSVPPPAAGKSSAPPPGTPGVSALLASSPSGPVDSVLAAVVIALIGFGVVMVYSASAIEATVRHHDAQYFLKRQALYAALALGVMWTTSRFDYGRLRPLTYPLLFGVTAMLVATVAGLGRRAGNA